MKFTFKKPENIALMASLIVTLLALVGFVFTLVQYQSLSSNNQDLQDELKETKRVQVQARNDMRDIYENQQAETDKFDIAAQDLVKYTREFLLETNRTVRFIDGNAQGLPTADEDRFDLREDEVEGGIDEIERQGSIVSQNANRVQEQVDQIYLNLGEDPNNRANPDGIR